ncbi:MULTISPECIES: SDR family oxidoreductase [Chryseobacterium]|uniref:SDR family oxidoreductase n=1 Tax=Chryseobacterium TaxID=59732 RepID=UPI001295A537|nr:MULTISPECIES: SDR family oxidoreductase [Chryseobacterium]MDR6923939.1 3-oxoacyl-[acyl-carrier protein] reductase [Chryseobacterium sp. 2987]
MMNEYCLVLGANGGIGLEISKYLIDKGYHLILHYNRSSDNIDELIKDQENHIKIKFDITDSNSIKNALKELGAGKEIRITKCINCVGIHYRSFIPLMPDNKFKEVIDTNLTGAFSIIKHISTDMIKNKKGTIVNISSVAGINGLIGQACYSSSKAGLDAITKIASKELAKYNIRVNSIAPGFIEAGIIEKPTANDLEYLERIPMRRFGRAREVAKLAYFLLEDKESSYITGQNIVIDGGLSINI